MGDYGASNARRSLACIFRKSATVESGGPSGDWIVVELTNDPTTPNDNMRIQEVAFEFNGCGAIE